MTYDLFKDEFDKVHPLISPRLKQEITSKALDPYFERNDWGYMGFSGGRPITGIPGSITTCLQVTS